MHVTFFQGPQTHPIRFFLHTFYHFVKMRNYNVIFPRIPVLLKIKIHLVFSLISDLYLYTRIDLEIRENEESEGSWNALSVVRMWNTDWSDECESLRLTE